jgi:hypothetical protein
MVLLFDMRMEHGHDAERLRNVYMTLTQRLHNVIGAFCSTFELPTNIRRMIVDHLGKNPSYYGVICHQVQHITIKTISTVLAPPGLYIQSRRVILSSTHSSLGICSSVSLRCWILQRQFRAWLLTRASSGNRRRNTAQHKQTLCIYEVQDKGTTYAESEAVMPRSNLRVRVEGRRVPLPRCLAWSVIDGDRCAPVSRR